MDAAVKKHAVSTVTNIALLSAFGLFIVSSILKEFVPMNVSQPHVTVTQPIVRLAPIPAPQTQTTTPTNAIPAANIIMPPLGQDLSISTTPQNAMTQKIVLIAPTLEQELQQTAPDNSANTRKGNDSSKDGVDLSAMSEHDFGQRAFIKKGLWGSQRHSPRIP